MNSKNHNVADITINLVQASQILTFVKLRPGVSTTELSEAIGIQKGPLLRLATGLVGLGLLDSLGKRQGKPPSKLQKRYRFKYIVTQEGSKLQEALGCLSRGNTKPHNGDNTSSYLKDTHLKFSAAGKILDVLAVSPVRLSASAIRIVMGESGYTYKNLTTHLWTLEDIGLAKGEKGMMETARGQTRATTLFSATDNGKAVADVYKRILLRVEESKPRALSQRIGA
ncbi:MAG: hypothetical protein KGH98_03020 [Candidatus Micrarchaeota archaeon]|nr:hypothetical protein [Candidatus Micrarchaeota archaeon]